MEEKIKYSVHCILEPNFSSELFYTNVGYLKRKSKKGKIPLNDPYVTKVLEDGTKTRVKKPFFELPGGKSNQGDLGPGDAMKRELIEETGIVPKWLRLIYIHVNSSGFHSFFFYYKTDEVPVLSQIEQQKFVGEWTLRDRNQAFQPPFGECLSKIGDFGSCCLLVDSRKTSKSKWIYQNNFHYEFVIPAEEKTLRVNSAQALVRDFQLLCFVYTSDEEMDGDSDGSENALSLKTVGELKKIEDESMLDIDELISSFAPSAGQSQQAISIKTEDEDMVGWF